MTIEYPITVKSIKHMQSETLNQNLFFGGKCGDMVAIRPCDEEYENKTFLGVLLGGIALATCSRFDKETGELTIDKRLHNPAIFVPDLNKIIYGIESWWGKIKDENSLREITNEDINNVWYIKALNQIEKERQANGRL